MTEYGQGDEQEIRLQTAPIFFEDYDTCKARIENHESSAAPDAEQLKKKKKRTRNEEKETKQKYDFVFLGLERGIQCFSEWLKTIHKNACGNRNTKHMQENATTQHGIKSLTFSKKFSSWTRRK